MKVLVLDVGGSHVKIYVQGNDEAQRISSGRTLRPETLVAAVKRLVPSSSYDYVSIGYPGSMGHWAPAAEPGNLGDGWVGYDFARALGCPVRMLNDAAMQALGAYKGGRMLFLGLGTGLGSALVADRIVVPVELGCLHFNRRETMADRVGKAGLRRHGLEKWRQSVHAIVDVLHRAFTADYVVLGGGNAKRLAPLPAGAQRGGNHDAVTGGIRLWEDWVEPHEPEPATWKVVR